MDKVFKHVGGGNPLYGPTFTVPESWSEWVQGVWIKALEGSGYILQEQPWYPTYDTGQVSWPSNDGSMQSASVNYLQFPSKVTVDQLAIKYAIDGRPLKVVEVPFLGLGPIQCPLLQRFLVDPTGKYDATVPAYQLANYFTNNPEHLSNAADALSRLYINSIWPGLLK